MPTINPGDAAAILAVQQAVLDWGHELDANDGVNIRSLITDDVQYFLGGTALPGPDGVVDFYAKRVERIKTAQKDGVRTQRHALSNIRVTLDGADRAKASFLVVNYSNEGKPPIMNLVGPTIVADARMEFARQADGAWRIALFDSEPVFVGNDPFLNANVMKK